jgi:hypothetical protein
MAQAMLEEEFGACKANTIVGTADYCCLAREIEIIGDMVWCRFGIG